MYTPTHTPSATELDAKAMALGLSDKARERLAWISYFLTHDHSITSTCAAFGISRSTFTRWLERFNPEDLGSMEEKSHEPFTVRQPTVPVQVVEYIRTYRKNSPLLGKERIAELLQAEHGVEISPSTVGRVIDRECLYFADTPLHWKKRIHSQNTVVAEQKSVVVDRDSRVLLRYEIKLDWRGVKRAAIFASVVTNIAVITILAFSALWESKVATENLNGSVSSQDTSPLPLP